MAHFLCHLGCSHFGALLLDFHFTENTTIFAFISGWNEYVFASVLLRSYSNWTLPIGIASFQGQYDTNWGTLMAGAVMITVPVVIIFWLLQKHLVAGMTAGAVKG